MHVIYLVRRGRKYHTDQSHCVDSLLILPRNTRKLELKLTRLVLGLALARLNYICKKTYQFKT